MDVNELVSTIAREVLKQLNGKQEKPCVMILGARDAKVAAKVQAHLDEEADFVYFMEPTNGRTPSRYILPHLCCASMADLALGRASGSLMTEVLRLLLSGVKVETLEFGYKAYAETAPDSLYKLYESYEKTLAGYGLKEFSRKRPEAVRFRESLVTEKDVAGAAEKGATTLMVSAAAVVTPLAVEAAKNMNINIVKGF
ncbi:MAG: hypothetical protein ACK5JO_13025 [Halodesulfovibrio sp.]